VVVLTHDDSGFCVGVDFGEASDVNEKSIVNADESSVDNLQSRINLVLSIGSDCDAPYVCTITTIPLPGPRIDIQKISSCWATIALIVVIKGLVVVLAKDL
jgi:hypothetical protein